jgi:AraC-like DNA-binding protein
MEVVHAVRRELGERLVAEGRMSITEIAFLLGFTDVSGFRRVYKRWTGVAPSRFAP